MKAAFCQSSVTFARHIIISSWNSFNATRFIYAFPRELNTARQQPVIPADAHKVLPNAVNATNTSHSRAEHQTCGLGDVSVEFGIIYC